MTSIGSSPKTKVLITYPNRLSALDNFSLSPSDTLALACIKGIISFKVNYVWYSSRSA